MKCMIAMLLFVLCGCSTVRQISTGMGTVDRLAEGIQHNMDEVLLLGVDNQVMALCEDTQEKAEQIRYHVEKARASLTLVEDKPDVFYRLTMMVKWLGIIAVVVFLLYIGVGQVLRPALNTFGKWLPTWIKSSAELDAKALNGEVDWKETVAARRSSSAAYNAAYKKASSKVKGETK